MAAALFSSAMVRTISYTIRIIGVLVRGVLGSLNLASTAALAWTYSRHSITRQTRPDGPSAISRNAADGRH